MRQITEKYRWFEFGICGLLVGGLALHVWFPAQQRVTEPANPSNAFEYFSLGQYYFNHDDDPAPPYDLEKAREYYAQAILKDPKANPLVWYQVGRIDFLEGKFHNATYKFEKQIEYFGDTVPSVHYMIGLTYGYKARQSETPADWEKAAKGFQAYIEHEPNSPWARTDLAWVYFSQGKYQEMLPVLEEGLEQNSNHPWLLNMYGLALLNTDRKEEARQSFVRAKEEAAKLTPADWGAAYPGNNPNDWAQGLREFQEAIENNIILTETRSE